MVRIELSKMEIFQSMKNKAIVVIFILFLEIGFVSITLGDSLQTNKANMLPSINISIQNQYNENNGSLSGYVTDSSMNSIQGAKINITCNGLFMETFSYATGRYYIGNIPIVDCYWNVSASKNGYESSYIWMSIDVSTTYDFILTPLAYVYVDDDAPSDWYDATHVKTIQEGVDNATFDDTILIYPGIYDENIDISKQIHLEGLDKENTIISSSHQREFLILDSVNYTTVCNLTFICSDTERHDIIRMINCSYCTIHDVDIYSDALQRSALIVNGSNNTITRVTINGRFIFSGIELFYTGENLITNNCVDSSGAGILIHRSHNNTISSNKITNNTNGIYLEEGNRNIITRNILKNNNQGLISSYSTKNNIEENNFIGNDEQAKFTKLFRIGFLSPNNWDGNYWDDWSGFFIKPILGVFYIPNGLIFGFFIPWFEIDWHPASGPFDI